MPKQKNNKHHLLYFDTITKQFIVTNPRDWARGNKHIFPTYSFVGDDIPVTETIEKWLIDNNGFEKKVCEKNEIVTVFNFCPTKDL